VRATLTAGATPICVQPTSHQNGQSVRVMRVKRLGVEDVSFVGAIDRSERIDVQYRVSEGQLQQVPAAMTEVPTWDPTGSGPHSVAVEIEWWWGDHLWSWRPDADPRRSETDWLKGVVGRTSSARGWSNSRQWARRGPL
jgi:hypothetical protein